MKKKHPVIKEHRAHYTHAHARVIALKTWHYCKIAPFTAPFWWNLVTALMIYCYRIKQNPP